MIQSGKGIFLSYASQDAEVARRICDALRAAGLEVWFDQSELRGGDAWDASIRRHIRECALFLPLISANTDARGEGYFRREWNLAVDRMLDMADDAVFLLPVLIDATPEPAARVPDRFRERQWSHLIGGEAPPSFVERVKGLLSGVTTDAGLDHEQRSLDACLDTRASHVGESRVRPAGRRAAVAGLALALALAGAVVVYFGGTFSDRGAFRDEKLMLAVLPFENLSGDAERSYFSDGLTEDLITELGRMNPERLGVIARTSVMQYRGTNKSIAEIGRELDVDYVVEGSVRREGERLRLAAQLIDVSDQSHRWAESYDRSMRAVLDLQAELANQIARAIRIEFGATRSGMSIGSAVDPEAYELLLLGKHHLYRWMPEGFVQARRYLSQALERDPGLAAAHAWLAMAHLVIAFYEIEPRAEAYASAVQAARRALELDPREGQALVVLAFKAYKYDWDWVRAEQLFRRAVEVSPNSPWPHWGYAHLLDNQGRHDEAIAEAGLALRLDPASLFMHFTVQFTLWDARRYDEAFAACEASRARLPDRPRAYYQCAIEVSERTAQFDRAIEMRARLSELGPAAGYYYKIEAGDREIAPLRRAYRERGPTGYWTWVKTLHDELGDYHAVNRAYPRAQLGELDEAIAVLESGVQRRDHSMTEIKVEPLLDPLRGDPRFQDLLRRMRLQK